MALVHLGRISSLTQVDLTGARITDSGLTAVPTLRSLSYLDLSLTAITTAGVEELEARLPNTTIRLRLRGTDGRSARPTAP